MIFFQCESKLNVTLESSSSRYRAVGASTVSDVLERVEEDVSKCFGKGETSRRFVHQHLLDQVEEIFPGLRVRRALRHVATQGLAVFADVATGRRLLVPNEATLFEVLDPSPGGHPSGKPA